jgi:hypothetical protein
MNRALSITLAMLFAMVSAGCGENFIATDESSGQPYFECFIDGNRFVPSEEGSFDFSAFSIIYNRPGRFFFGDTFNLRVNAHRTATNQYLEIECDSVMGSGLYAITSISYSMTKGNRNVDMTRVVNGQMNVVFDTSRSWIRGTFNLRCASREGDTATFTDGKFGGPE